MLLLTMAIVIFTKKKKMNWFSVGISCINASNVIDNMKNIFFKVHIIFLNKKLCYFCHFSFLYNVGYTSLIFL